MKRLLGIDVGTTAMKAGLYDDKLNEIASCSAEYGLITEGDRVECDPETYVKMLTDCIGRVAGGQQIDAISVDTQCETLILTDGTGKPLGNAIVWLDNRAGEEAVEIETHFGAEEIYRHTGQPQTAAAWPACKLLWLKKHIPGVFSRARKIFLLGDWLTYRLTGNFVTEGTLQSSSLYFDIAEHDWWDGMLDYIGVSRDMLPAILHTGDIAGYYRGIPVVAGAMDQIAGAVGAGAVREGIVTEMTGTTLAVFSACGSIPGYDPSGIVPCHLNHDGKYCRLMWTSAAGLALKWFRDGFMKELSFAGIDRIAKDIPPGSDGVCFVPHLCGSTMPVYDPSATAAFCGVRLCHNSAHFARAVMESVAFMLDECLDCLGNVGEIRSTGGGAKSSLWNQIKADVTGRTVAVLKAQETATRGSAIFAGVGIGVFPSVAAAGALVAPAERYIPSGTDYSGAKARYKEYCRRVNPKGTAADVR